MNERQRRFWVVWVLLFAALAMNGHAAQLVISTAVYSGVGTPDFNYEQLDCAHCTGSVAVRGHPGLSVVFDTASRSSFGSYGVAASAHLDGSSPVIPGNPYDVRVEANAGSIETLTVYGAPTGTPGTMTLAFDVEGTIASDPYASASWSFLTVADRAVFIGPSITGVGAHSQRVTTAPMPFIYGVPWMLGVNMSAGVSFYELAPLGRSADIDFYHSAILRFASTYDAEGHSVASRIVSDSGFTYSTVPEPAALPLAGSGLLALAVGLRRRRN